MCPRSRPGRRNSKPIWHCCSREPAVDDARDSLEKKCAILERKVGQLVIEKEYLEKSASSWGLIDEKEDDRERPSPAVYS